MFIDIIEKKYVYIYFIVLFCEKQFCINIARNSEISRITIRGNEFALLNCTSLLFKTFKEMANTIVPL